jgi:hypothetical protein
VVAIQGFEVEFVSLEEMVNGVLDTQLVLIHRFVLGIILELEIVSCLPPEFPMNATSMILLATGNQDDTQLIAKGDSWALLLMTRVSFCGNSRELRSVLTS